MAKSKEEKFLEKLERERIAIQKKAAAAILKEEAKIARDAAKREREALKAAKAKEPKIVKPEPTEEELVRRYVNRTIRNQQYHGRIENRFDGLEYEKSVSKNLWLDTDFFFSVVFQSRRQKLEFMEKWEQMHSAVEEVPSKIQIINGLKLAKALGIELKMEESRDYPLPELELLPFVLDNTET